MRFALLINLLLLAPATADELLFPNSNFETGTLEGWTAEGEAFSNQPTKGDNPTARNRESSEHEGDYWIGTYENFHGKANMPGATRLESAW